MYPPEIQSSMVQYPSQDGTQINAYLSRPAAAGRYPGVVVIMEAFGLNDHIKDVARRFAEQGYIAVAPDMYTRGLCRKLAFLRPNAKIGCQKINDLRD